MEITSVIYESELVLITLRSGLIKQGHTILTLSKKEHHSVL